jgi:hypothetical protein
MSYWIPIFCETSERFRAAKYGGSIYQMNTQYATLVNKTAKTYYKRYLRQSLTFCTGRACNKKGFVMYMKIYQGVDPTPQLLIGSKNWY